ncbi:substrate-binding domain-containing protein [Fontivita pretiosa]|uniref:ABC transporter substrate-binding protein n=1 Tax=Fontivita pretiosa TaxID=2989684 RepID=UPI003D16FA12
MFRHRFCLGVLVLAVMGLIAIGCDNSGQSGKVQPGATTGQSSAAGATLDIAVIPKGTTHSFWKAVEAGARKAQAELGVNVIWRGPLKENDRQQQIDIVQQFISEGVDGIVLAPLDDTALRRPVQSAMGSGIPVVIFDSGLKGEPGKDFISFVATNNRLGGAMAGEALAKELGGRGKVVLLRYQEGSASTTERETGFLEALRKYPEIQVISENRYAGATTDDAMKASMQLLDQLQAADGIFCPNESSTHGMLLALRQAQLAGKKKFVGFDASAPLIDALRKGEIAALVSQDPMKMGYLGVKTLVSHIKGEKVEPVIDTGVQLLTRENLDTPEIKALISTQ